MSKRDFETVARCLARIRVLVLRRTDALAQFDQECEAMADEMTRYPMFKRELFLARIKGKV